MTTWAARIDLRDSQLLGDQDYSVNFHVTSIAGSDEAYDLARAFADTFAAHVIPNWVHVVKVSIRNSDVINGNQTRDVFIAGARGSTGSSLPGFNTVRFLGRISAGHRPSVWHFRMGLTEDDVDGQILDTDALTALAAFVTALGGLDGICDKNGFTYDSYEYDPVVRNRQMSWRRRTRVGYHRGWVLNA